MKKCAKRSLIFVSITVLISVSIVIRFVIFPLDKPDPDADTKPSFPDWSKIVYYFNNEMNYVLPGLILEIDPITSVGYRSGAHVRFIEMKRHFDKEKRAEYIFEVIEWLNVQEGVEDLP